MCLIEKEVELKDGIDFANFNGLGIAPKASEYIEGEDSAALVKRNMTDDRSGDDGHWQAVLFPDEDWRRAAPCSISSVHNCL